MGAGYSCQLNLFEFLLETLRYVDVDLSFLMEDFDGSAFATHGL
jgi:hypothetical protein